jgi:hypothetical protein
VGFTPRASPREENQGLRFPSRVVDEPAVFVAWWEVRFSPHREQFFAAAGICAHDGRNTQEANVTTGKGGDRRSKNQSPVLRF